PLAFLKVLGNRGGGTGDAADVIHNWGKLLPQVIDHGAHRICWRAFCRRLDDREIPIQGRADATGNIDERRTGYAEAATDHGMTVTTNKSIGLLVDIRLGVHLLVGVQYDPPHGAGPSTKYLDFSTDRQTAYARLRQHDPQMRHRTKPVMQHARFQHRH